jgi:hypothetical protein
MVFYDTFSLAYFPKVAYAMSFMSVCPCVCVPKQQGLLFDEKKVRPFSVGALTVEQRTSPPPSQTETVLLVLNVYLMHRGGPKREHLV